MAWSNSIGRSGKAATARTLVEQACRVGDEEVIRSAVIMEVIEYRTAYPRQGRPCHVRRRKLLLTHRPANASFLALGLGAAILLLGGTAYLLEPWIGVRAGRYFGALAFILLVAAFSANLRAVNWRTLLCGIALCKVFSSSSSCNSATAPGHSRNDPPVRVNAGVSAGRVGQSPFQTLALASQQPPQSISTSGFEVFRTAGTA